MFGMVLKDMGKRRLVYSTSTLFRVVFLGIALFIFLTVLIFSEGSIFRSTHIVALTLCGICLLASLFLERWVFDMSASLFEQHVGLIWLYRRRSRPIDTLRKIVLDEYSRGVQAKSRMGSMISRRTVVLYLQDRDDRVYKLNIAKDSGAAEIRRTAVKLSDFCGIPFEDNLRDSSESDRPSDR